MYLHLSCELHNRGVPRFLAGLVEHHVKELAFPKHVICCPGSCRRALTQAEAVLPESRFPCCRCFAHLNGQASAHIRKFFHPSGSLGAWMPTSRISFPTLKGGVIKTVSPSTIPLTIALWGSFVWATCVHKNKNNKASNLIMKTLRDLCADIFEGCATLT